LFPETFRAEERRTVATHAPQAVPAEATAPSIRGLTVDFAQDPLGIDHRTPSLGWKLQSPDRDVVQIAYQIRVASTADLLEQDRPDLWDSGKVQSNQQLDIVYAGQPLSSRQEALWQVRVWTSADRASQWSDVARWEMGLLEAGDWTATWIADPASSHETAADPLPIFACQFDADQGAAIEKARLYVAGMGLYEARLNGAKVGDALLTPSPTDFRKRALYKTYDVTSEVRGGANRLGLLVGNGLFNIPEKEDRYWASVTWETGVVTGDAIRLVGQPAVIAQMEITYSDGRVQTVGSDTAWHATPGPIEFSGYYGGEDYDARRWQPGWDEPDSDLSGWHNATRAASAPTTLSAQFEPAPIAVERLEPVDIQEVRPGVHVFDFGTNFVGWPELKVQGPAGTRVTMLPGWYVADDGGVSQAGMIGWTSTGNVADHYTLAGTGEEVWHPRFSYHGFRYVEVRGLPHPPTRETVTGIVVHAPNAPTGTFRCSDDLLSDIHRIANRSVRSTMLGPTLPSDPNREKAGWAVSSQFEWFARNFDLASYNRAMARDVTDAQREDGDVPGVVPNPTDFWFVGDPNWSGTLIVQCYDGYRTYGDTALLRDHYPAMQRYFAYLESRAADGVIPGGPMTEGYFGDWLYPGQEWQDPFNADNAHVTPPSLTATWGYWRCAVAMAGIARALGRRGEAEEYATKASAIVEAFNREFFRPEDHTYGSGSQASDALALDMGAPLADERDRVLEHLVDSIRQGGDHLNVGAIGLPTVVRVLAAAGRNDVLYDTATQTTYPSYGFWLSGGATSVPESWDWKNGDNVPDLQILGGLDPWFTRDLGGIQAAPDAIAFDKIVIAPAVVGSLSDVEAAFETVRGTISSRWHRDGTALTLDVEVPPNTTATVVVPLLAPGAQVDAPPHATQVARDDRCATFEIGSGASRFTQAP
jgi:alpha-L-rhamnosidase